MIQLLNVIMGGTCFIIFDDSMKIIIPSQLLPMP